MMNFLSKNDNFCTEGAHIVSTILSDPALESQWYAELNFFRKNETMNRVPKMMNVALKVTNLSFKSSLK